MALPYNGMPYLGGLVGGLNPQDSSNQCPTYCGIPISNKTDAEIMRQMANCAYAQPERKPESIALPDYLEDALIMGWRQMEVFVEGID